MPKAVHELSRTSSSSEMPVYSADLEGAMQDTLATMADVDLIYELRREIIGSHLASERQRECLRAELDAVYKSERQPLVMRLADLHDRMMRVTLYRALH
jgi:hypothetical protein